MLQKLLQKRFPAVIGITLLLAACMKSPEERVLHDTAHTVILPLYQQFAVQANTLKDSTRAFCAAGTKTTELFDTLHYAWLEAVKGWSAVQMLQMGPGAEDNRAWKIEFWPDLNNLVARKVEQLLAGDKPLTAETLKAQSAIVQGLSAMEYLLFDEEGGRLSRYGNDDAGSERRCELLAAVAAHTHSVADDMRAGWEPQGGNFVETFSDPGPDNEHYPDEKAALTALVDSLVFGIEQIRHDKLERPLALDDGERNPYRLEWWRSRSAREAIAANLTSIQRLFTAENGFGLDDYLYDVPEGRALSRDIQELVATAHKHVAGAGQPLADVDENTEQYEELLKAHRALEKLERLLKEDLTSKLGITLSFNANDGD